MAACVLGFVCTFLIVFLRRQSTPADAPKLPLVRWISPRTLNASNNLRPLVAELDDPSLMSLPSTRAFSAALWRQQAGIEAQPIQPSNSIAYLDAAPPREPALLLASSPLRDAVRAAAQKPEASFPEPVPDGIAPSAGHSTIQFDQRLESFRLLNAPALPVIDSETALRPAVVRVAIGPDGTVAHAVLDRSCGNDNADTLALDAARRLRFALSVETDRRTLLWGTARILWATKLPDKRTQP